MGGLFARPISESFHFRTPLSDNLDHTTPRLQTSVTMFEALVNQLVGELNFNME